MNDDDDFLFFSYIVYENNRNDNKNKQKKQKTKTKQKYQQILTRLKSRIFIKILIHVTTINGCIKCIHLHMPIVTNTCLNRSQCIVVYKVAIMIVLIKFSFL